MALAAEQAVLLEKLNPCFRKRCVESSPSGGLLSAAHSLGAVSKASARSFCTRSGTSSAFSLSKQPEAVAAAHNEVPPFHRTLDLPVAAILSVVGREFRGTERHPCELDLDLDRIEHRRTRVRTPTTAAKRPRPCAASSPPRSSDTQFRRDQIDKIPLSA